MRFLLTEKLGILLVVVGLPQYNHLDFVGQWIGDVRGAAIGNAYVETTLRDTTLLFEISVGTAAANIKLAGTLTDDGSLTVRLTVTYPAPKQGEAAATGILQLHQMTPDRMTGKWSLSSGADGIIMVSRADTKAKADNPDQQIRRPAEFVVKEDVLPSVTLYRRDLEAIAARLTDILPLPAKIIVTAEVDGRNLTQYADDFLRRTGSPRVLNHIKLNITDNAQPLAKTIVAILSIKEGNKIIVQSGDSTWTSGTHAEMVDLMNRYVSRPRAFFQRHGLKLNMMVSLAAIITVPDLPFVSRIPFILAVVFMLQLLVWLHHWTTRTTIYLDETERGAWAKEIPTVVLGLGASVATGIAAKLYEYFSSEGFSILIERLNEYVSRVWF